MANSKIWLSSPHMGDSEMAYVNEAFDTNWIAPVGPHLNRFEEFLDFRYFKWILCCCIKLWNSCHSFGFSFARRFTMETKYYVQALRFQQVLTLLFIREQSQFL